MFDTYHCALRISCIAFDSGENEIEWDRLRLLDFYVTFPHLLRKMRMPKEFMAERSALKEVLDPYESLPSPAKLFFQLGEIESAAAKLLAAGGFIDRDSLLRGAVVLQPTSKHRLQDLLAPLQFRNSRWYALVVNKLAHYPMHGHDGLKNRSGLMEYRHDAA